MFCFHFLKLVPANGSIEEKAIVDAFTAENKSYNLKLYNSITGIVFKAQL